MVSSSHGTSGGLHLCAALCITTPQTMPWQLLPISEVTLSVSTVRHKLKTIGLEFRVLDFAKFYSANSHARCWLQARLAALCARNDTDDIDMDMNRLSTRSSTRTSSTADLTHPVAQVRPFMTHLTSYHL